MQQPTSTKAWQPLLEGEDASRVRAVISQIADAIAREPLVIPGDQSPGRDACLAGGRAGIALFHGYLALFEDVRELERCGRHVDHVADVVTSVPMAPDLFSGIAGIAWVLDHLSGALLDLGDGDPLGPIDRLLRAQVDAEAQPAAYDLISGWVGYGVYALARRSEDADAILDRVLDRLEASAQRVGDGLTWFTPPELLSTSRREDDPAGHFDLGLAHGVPGVIGLLARMLDAGVEPERTSTLLRGAVSWLLTQKLPQPAGSVFPAFAALARTPSPSRLAWCYGDAGVGMALLSAAAATGDAQWRAEALAVLRHAARRLPDDAGIVDAPLCHGAAGLMHIFNRAYHATGEPLFREAARRWCFAVLELQSGHEAVAGFPARRPRAGKDPWEDDPGFLGGAAGVGLALLAAVTDVEPEWDACMLLDVAPQGVQ